MLDKDKMTYSVIIPIHNIVARGYKRLKWQLLSLENQKTPPAAVYVADSSGIESQIVKSICGQAWKMPVIYSHYQIAEGFNMPKLFNRSLEKVESDYVLCTGIDFVYHPQFGTRLMGLATPGRFIMSEVLMLPNTIITPEMVTGWDFPKAKPNKFGRTADGIQFAATEFFHKIGGYDERMQGWGGMDNDMHWRAVAYGQQEMWTRRQVLHIHHKIEKGAGANLEQTKRNWALLEKKRKENDFLCKFISK